MKIFAKIKSIYAAIVIVILVTLNILCFMLANEKNYKKIKRFFSNAILKLLRIEVEYVGDIDNDAQMLVMNHSSLIDIVAIEAIYPKDMVWIAKKELFDTPFFGLLLKLPKNIKLDREDKRSIIYLLKEAKEKVKYKTIAIFPEGTRGRGERLLPFKPGAKIIANQLKLKVQPAVIVCSKERFDSKSLKYNPGKVKVIFLDSFYPENNKDWLSDLRKKMQEILDKEKKSLCPNSRSTKTTQA